MTFQVNVTPREYTKYWDDGTKIGGKIGLSAGGHGYVKGCSEAGMSVGILHDDRIIMARRGSEALGLGAGVETPGAKFSIGGVARGKLAASASAELLVMNLKEDEYLFHTPQQTGQKMAQAALLLHHITTLGGHVDPFVLKMIKMMLGITDQNYYSNYRTYEMAGLGINVSAGAEAGLGFGFGPSGNPDSFGLGIGIETGAGAELSASAQYLKYYQDQAVTGTGLALDQYVDVDLGNISITAGMYFEEKETGGELGRKWEPLRIGKAVRFTEKLVWDTRGELVRIMVSISGDDLTQVYVIEGKENIEATKAAAENLMNMALSLSTSGTGVIIGPKQIKQELENLLSNAAKVRVSYEIIRAPTQTQIYPFSLEAALGIKAGFEAELTLAQHVDAISERGVVVKGWEFPLEGYETHPESDKKYGVIVNNALSGAWEIIKDKFQQVARAVQAGVEVVVEAAAATVDSAVKFAGKLKESVEVVLRIWTPDESPYPFPAPASPQYARAFQQATAPIIGAYYQFTPEGAELSEAGTLQISYSDDDVRKYGANELSLRISYWDVENSRWVSVGGTVDREKNTVTATIRRLHLYAITFDSTPPGIGQLNPPPDSIITGLETIVQVRIVDDTNQLDASTILMLLDNMTVPYVFDGEVVTYVVSDLFVGRHSVTVRAGDLYGNVAERTWSFTVRNPQATPWDVNGDGIVDMLDLEAVGKAFGMSGQGLAVDVNGDELVDIRDLVTVASHFGEEAGLGAPAEPRMANSSDIDMLEGWLMAARLMNDDSGEFRRGIAVLEYLLRSTVPRRTALLQNYPNPFNPDTWIPYQLSQEADVAIIIYDSTGRMVRQLNVGRKAAGTYRTQSSAAHWDGRNDEGEASASGIYFVLLKAGDYRHVRRMVLLR